MQLVNQNPSDEDFSDEGSDVSEASEDENEDKLALGGRWKDCKRIFLPSDRLQLDGSKRGEKGIKSRHDNLQRILKRVYKLAGSYPDLVQEGGLDELAAELKRQSEELVVAHTKGWAIVELMAQPEIELSKATMARVKAAEKLARSQAKVQPKGQGKQGGKPWCFHCSSFTHRTADCPTQSKQPV